MNEDEESENGLACIFISGGSLLLFVIAVFNKSYVEGVINSSFAASIKYFGAFWQVLLIGTFIVAMCMAFSKYGRVKLGD